MKFMFFVLMVMFTGLGCAMRSARSTSIVQFAGAVDQLASQALQVYEEIDLTERQKNIAIQAHFVPLESVQNLFDQTEHSQQLASTMVVVNSLRHYTQALAYLNEADEIQDIDKASHAFYKGLNGLRKHYSLISSAQFPLSGSALAIISSAFDFVERSISQKKIWQATKKVIVHSDALIMQSCEYLIKQSAHLREIVKSNLNNTEQQMLEAYNQQKPEISYPQRVALLKRISELHYLKNHMDEYFQIILYKAQSLKKAQKILKDATLNRGSNLKKLKQEVKVLDSLDRDISRFYKSLR